MKKKILSAVLACAATMTFATGAFADDAVTTADNAPEETVIVNVAGFKADTDGKIYDENGTANLNDMLLVNNGVRYKWSDVEALVVIGDGDFKLCFTADAAKAGTDLVVIGETEIPEEFEDEDIDFKLIIELGDGEFPEGAEESDDASSDAESDESSDTSTTESEADEPSVQDDASVVDDTNSDDADSNGEGEDEDEVHGTIVIKGFGGKTMELFDSTKADGGEVAIAAVEGEVNIIAYAQMKDGAVGTPIPAEGTTTTNPATGIALAVAPAALAVAFVSVAAVANKKKK